MTQLLASKYSSWYKILNQIRSKHGKANIPVYSVTSKQPAESSQMTTLQSSINTVKTSTDSHLTSRIIDTTIPNIAVGNKILLTTETKINNIITTMYNVCHHDSYNSDRDDDGSMWCGSDHGDRFSYDAIEYGGYSKCGLTL